jgi:SpoU rRNA methylase family enzyme
MMNRKAGRFPFLGRFVPPVGVALILVAAVSVAATQSGVKQTEKLAKRAGDTVKAIEETKQQLERTLNLYNSIVQNKTEDTKKAYKDLGKWMEECDKKRANVGVKVESMEKEAHTFFAEWTQSLDGITNPDMRKRSQDRLNETRVRYGDILTAGRQAGGEFDAFMGSLHDQFVYLGYDLNPAALASLAGDAKKLNAQAAAMFEEINKTTKLANEYISSLRPTS